MNDRNKYLILIKDSVIFAVGSIGSKLIIFLMVPLYTNIMSTAEYGTAELFQTVTSMLYSIFCLNIFSAVIRFGLSNSEQREDVLACALAIGGIGSVACILLTPAVKLYSALSPWRWALCANTIFTLLLNIEMNYLKASDKNIVFAVTSLAQSLILALSNVVLLLVFRLGVKGFVISYLLSAFSACAIPYIWGNIHSDIRRGKFKPELAKNMVRYSAPLVISALSWWIIHSSDKIMIDRMLDTASLGLYAVAAKVPTLINLFSGIFMQAWGISSIREIETTEDTSFYSEVLVLYSTGLFLATILLVMLIQPFMQIYVGKAFTVGWIYAPLLIIAATFSSISGFFETLYAALKLSTNNMICTLLCAVLNVVINFIGIRKIGIMGAVLGTSVAYIVLALIKMIDIRRHMDINIPFSFIVNSLLIIAQAVLITMRFNTFVTSGTVFVFFILINRKKLKESIIKVIHISKTIIRKVQPNTNTYS